MNRQYPRLVLRDSSFRSNARETISRCAACGIQVCGVIKGVNGLPEVARRFRECGVTQLGTSRLEQVERCRQAGIPGPYLLIRIPGPTELPELVRLCEMSLQSERKTLDLLEQEGAEAIVPDLMDFLNYCVYNAGYKHEFLGGTWRSAKVGDLAVKAIARIRRPAIQALKASRRFDPPLPIAQVAEYAKPFLSVGNQYGEGWFLTGEMVELIHSGAPNIVCIQPFACLPNHVVGKGVIKLLRKTFPQANIVAVDYDPGASEVNQLNRIKLMLANARLAEQMTKQEENPAAGAVHAGKEASAVQ